MKVGLTILEDIRTINQTGIGQDVSINLRFVPLMNKLDTEYSENARYLRIFSTLFPSYNKSVYRITRFRSRRDDRALNLDLPSAMRFNSQTKRSIRISRLSSDGDYTSSDNISEYPEGLSGMIDYSLPYRIFTKTFGNLGISVDPYEILIDDRHEVIPDSISSESVETHYSRMVGKYRISMIISDDVQYSIKLKLSDVNIEDTGNIYNLARLNVELHNLIEFMFKTVNSTQMNIDQKMVNKVYPHLKYYLDNTQKYMPATVEDISSITNTASYWASHLLSLDDTIIIFNQYGTYIYDINDNTLNLIDNEGYYGTYVFIGESLDESRLKSGVLKDSRVVKNVIVIRDCIIFEGRTLNNSYDMLAERYHKCQMFAGQYSDPSKPIIITVNQKATRIVDFFPMINSLESLGMSSFSSYYNINNEQITMLRLFNVQPNDRSPIMSRGITFWGENGSVYRWYDHGLTPFYLILRYSGSMSSSVSSSISSENTEDRDNIEDRDVNKSRHDGIFNIETIDGQIVQQLLIPSQISDKYNLDSVIPDEYEEYKVVKSDLPSIFGTRSSVKRDESRRSEDKISIPRRSDLALLEMSDSQIRSAITGTLICDFRLDISTGLFKIVSLDVKHSPYSYSRYQNLLDDMISCPDISVMLGNTLVFVKYGIFDYLAPIISRLKDKKILISDSISNILPRDYIQHLSDKNRLFIESEDDDKDLGYVLTTIKSEIESYMSRNIGVIYLCSEYQSAVKVKMEKSILNVDDIDTDEISLDDMSNLKGLRTDKIPCINEIRSVIIVQSNLDILNKYIRIPVSGDIMYKEFMMSNRDEHMLRMNIYPVDGSPMLSLLRSIGLSDLSKDTISVYKGRMGITNLSSDIEIIQSVCDYLNISCFIVSIEKMSVNRRTEIMVVHKLIRSDKYDRDTGMARNLLFSVLITDGANYAPISMIREISDQLIFNQRDRIIVYLYAAWLKKMIDPIKYSRDAEMARKIASSLDTGKTYNIFYDVINSLEFNHRI